MNPRFYGAALASDGRWAGRGGATLIRYYSPQSLYARGGGACICIGFGEGCLRICVPRGSVLDLQQRCRKSHPERSELRGPGRPRVL